MIRSDESIEYTYYYVMVRKYKVPEPAAFKKSIKAKKIPYNEKLHETILSLRNRIVPEIQNSAGSKFYLGGSGEYSRFEDWNIQAFVDILLAEYPRFDLTTMRQILSLSLNLFYLR